MEDLRLRLEGVVQGDLPKREVFKGVLNQIASSIITIFSLEEDEVAIILIRDKGQLLRFAYPLELYEGGMNAFPVTASSVAGQVVRSRQGLFFNDFQEIRHLSIYEKMRLKGREPRDIQKILSAPLILPDSKVIGVVQISRKGKSLAEAGKDFSKQDLEKLASLCSLAAPYLSKSIPPDF
ncbi:MAG: GAF domain-containing protein [candidate division NC10 bacterium]|nr:GAF domain-containing protein [candidate division NC10 bacterium]